MSPQDYALHDLIEVAGLIGVMAVAHYRVRQLEKQTKEIENRTREIENGWGSVREKMGVFENSLAQIKEQTTRLERNERDTALAIAQLSKEMAVVVAYVNHQWPVGKRSNDNRNERSE